MTGLGHAVIAETKKESVINGKSWTTLPMNEVWLYVPEKIICIPVETPNFYET